MLAWLCQKDIMQKSSRSVSKWNVLLGIFFSEDTMAVSGFQMLWKVGVPNVHCVAVPKICWQMTSQQCGSDNASLLLYFFTLGVFFEEGRDAGNCVLEFYVLLKFVAGLRIRRMVEIEGLEADSTEI